jgi:hypothetical protein
MCKSAAEGGQRCPSRARDLYVEAVEAYQDVLLERTDRSGSHHAVREHDAFEAVRQARVQYASTPQGEARLCAMADRNNDDLIREDVRRGIEVRNRNAEVRRQARRGAARTVLTRKARDRVSTGGTYRRWMHTTETKTLHTRFDAFAALAERDESLKAPASFASQARTCANRANLSSLGRVATYALWRAQGNGAEFAPPAPEGSTYTSQVTGWDDLHPGDVLTEPGYRDPGDVEHEGKVVAATRRESGGLVVDFTDGTSDQRFRGVFTVLRPVTPEQEQALARYNALAFGPSARTGRDNDGYWARNETGEKVYRP